MKAYHLAQYNVGRVHAPLDHPALAEFIAALEPVNSIAESTPGFVWRLKDADGQSSSYVRVPGIEDPLFIINYSIWEDLDSLKHFIYKSGHGAYLRRRREWFELLRIPTSAAWWIEAGEIPQVDEAHRRLIHLRANGPSEHAWPLNRPWPAPSP